MKGIFCAVLLVVAMLTFCDSSQAQGYGYAAPRAAAALTYRAPSYRPAAMQQRRQVILTQVRSGNGQWVTINRQVRPLGYR